MRESMNITSSTYAAALLTLPWGVPLEQWPAELITALPRGISRHVVRFIELGAAPTQGVDARTGVVAVKEIGVRTAHHEYKMLRELQRVGAPAVAPVAVITGRQPDNPRDGELTAALITEHLEFSLPYRELFSQDMVPAQLEKLIQALAVLIVRLHLLGFYWGDVSLSNTLFRRDADTYSAYLVDAETGEFQAQLSDARRSYDLDTARINIIGEMMDLQAGGYLAEDIDVIALGTLVESSYEDLWRELTAEEAIDAGEPWRITERVERLASIGFDVGELSVETEADRATAWAPPSPAPRAHRLVGGGTPGTAPAGCHPHVPRLGMRRDGEPRAGGAPLAHGGIRADHRRRAGRRTLQARARAALPRDFGPQVVYGRASRRRRTLGRGHAVLPHDGPTQPPR